MSEWKRGMSYMWSSKAMRKAFFCGFDLLGGGGALLFIALAMAVPVFAGLLGFEMSIGVGRWIYMLAFMGQILVLELVIEIPMVHRGMTGKTIGGVPFAKWIMTKGLIVNEVIYYFCSLAVMLGIYGIGMVTEAVDGSLVDDIVFFVGLFFFLDHLFRMIVGFFRRDGQNGSVALISGATATIARNIGRVHLSVGRSALWHMVFMVTGVLVLYLHLVRGYKRRNGTAN